MTAARASLAGRLRAGDALRLVFVKMPCPAEVELAGATGFDAIIIDTEHGRADGLEHHLRAAAAAGIPALVRVPNTDAGPILHALDAGATGIVVAHVTGARTAADAVDAAHYPPRGHRGLALSTRAGGYGTISLPDHLVSAAAETIIVVQIEDADAIARSREILEVDGVDAVLIGATDLSVSLACPGEREHPRLVAAIAEIRSAAVDAGVAVAEVVGSPGDAEANRSAGTTVAVFVSTMLVRDAFRAAAARSTVASVGEDPIVFVPGMLGTEALWDEVIPALATHAPVRFARIDLDDAVDEMAASLLALAPDTFGLAGHSLGAAVAIAVARRAPARVTRLALLNASARPASQAQCAAWAELEQRATEGDFRALVAEFARANVAADRAGDVDLIAQVEAMASQVGPRGLLRQLAAQRGRPDARHGLGAIACPTVVVSGALDTVCPPALQVELAAGLPRARLVTLERCGHMSPLEAPAAVARALADWLVGGPDRDRP